MKVDRNIFFIALELGDMDEEDEFLMLSDALFPPREFEIPGWCPACPFLPHGEKVCFFTLCWPPF